MKMNPDPESDDSLLDSILRDEDWQKANTAFKAQAVSAFRARQRRREWTRLLSGAIAVIALAALTTHWFGGSTSSNSPSVVSQTPATNAPVQAHYLTDQQLLDLFPKGSCFIAEVNGKKQLVFLDPKLEKRYMAQPAPPSH